ncbi:MAG: hypothetical protein GXO86_14490 [Chlorobi bacterium]|nr:hypothetical protein [Chlorobiota bacterium]
MSTFTSINTGMIIPVHPMSMITNIPASTGSTIMTTPATKRKNIHTAIKPEIVIRKEIFRQTIDWREVSGVIPNWKNKIFYSDC